MGEKQIEAVLSELPRLKNIYPLLFKDYLLQILYIIRHHTLLIPSKYIPRIYLIHYIT